MPNYDYKCKKCDKIETITKSMSESSRKEYCKQCGEEMQRIFSPTKSQWKCGGAYDGRLK